MVSVNIPTEKERKRSTRQVTTCLKDITGGICLNTFLHIVMYHYTKFEKGVELTNLLLYMHTIIQYMYKHVHVRDIILNKVTIQKIHVFTHFNPLWSISTTSLSKFISLLNKGLQSQDSANEQTDEEHALYNPSYRYISYCQSSYRYIVCHTGMQW